METPNIYGLVSRNGVLASLELLLQSLLTMGRRIMVKLGVFF
jgi:hypothetical protein